MRPRVIQVADDHAHVLFRDHHSTDMIGSSNTGEALRAASLKAHEAAILNAIFVGIYFVIAAVIERDFDIDKLITRPDAAFHGLLHALFNSA